MLVRLRAGDDDDGGGGGGVVVGGGGAAAVSDAAGARRSFFSCCYSSLCSVISLVCANLCKFLAFRGKKRDSRGLLWPSFLTVRSTTPFSSNLDPGECLDSI